MAPHPIKKGTLVAVAEDRRMGRRPSAGGIGPVVRKKRKKNDGTVVSLTQESDATGTSLYDVKYSVDNRLSQDVTRDRIQMASYVRP